MSELDGGECTVDELAAAAKLRVAEVSALLASLELDGLVARVESGRYRVCRR